MTERMKNIGSTEPYKLPDECIACMSKFKTGALESRRPETVIEMKNCKKLFQSGVLDVFARESESLNPDLEIYFTDDFSKICLRKKVNEKRESLMSVGIGHDETGAIDIRAIVKNNVLSPLPKNEFGLATLKGIFQGVAYSSQHKIV